MPGLLEIELLVAEPHGVTYKRTGAPVAIALTVIAGSSLADARTGKNGRHALVRLLRQSVFSRLAGYEDVNDAEREQENSGESQSKLFTHRIP
jgi:hypothetical protein